VLPAGLDIDLGPIPLGPANNYPVGTYELSCRIVDPVTKRQLTIDLNPFEVQ
jgi:hypothetical protein